MARIALFRVKVISQNPVDYVDGIPNRAQVLDTALRSSPSAQTTRTVTWRLGNLDALEEGWLYFRIGKTTQTRNEVFENGNFVDLDSDAAPSTAAFLHVPLGILGIVPKPLLATHVKGIARRLEEVLNNAAAIQQATAKVEISDVTNSTQFVREVQNASAVEKFWFHIKPPNPPDEAELLRALQSTLSRVNGNKGKMEVTGTSLQKPEIVEIASSAMSAGNLVGAIIRDDGGVEGRPIKSSDYNRKEITVNRRDLASPDRRSFIARLIRAAYDTVRRPGQTP